MLRRCELTFLSRNNFIRLFSSSLSGDVQPTTEKTCPQPVLRNRNPRNLELMRIGYKPVGFHLDKANKSYWHKLELIRTNKQATAQVIHYLNGVVIEVSTSEIALRKQLYRVTDTAAHINLGRLLAQRCLRAGIFQMFCNIEPTPGGKVEKFLEQLKEGGVILEESDRYKKPYPWDRERPIKPWEVEV